jgi:hypothetical protein
VNYGQIAASATRAGLTPASSFNLCGRTAEELATLLQLVHLISTHPKNREAGPDFSHLAGLGKKHERKQTASP